MRIERYMWDEHPVLGDERPSVIWWAYYQIAIEDLPRDPTKHDAFFAAIVEANATDCGLPGTAFGKDRTWVVQYAHENVQDRLHKPNRLVIVRAS